MWKPLSMFTKRNVKDETEATSEASLLHWIDMATADGFSMDEEFGLDRPNVKTPLE